MTKPNFIEQKGVLYIWTKTFTIKANGRPEAF